MTSIIDLFSKKTMSQPTFKHRIEQVRKLLSEADHVLIGAGSGLSAAAGLDYGGVEFKQEFHEWIERYGFKDLYSSSFYPFPTEEERWAYWARHIWFTRYRVKGMELYHQLFDLVKDKNYFVITTNVDAQFEKSGFDKKRIFATQGDYAYFQAKGGENKKLIYNEEWVKQAMDATINCKVPTSLIPHHPDTGEALSPNLRCDSFFVEDEHWHQQADKYQDFVLTGSKKNMLLLEFGVGFNTPIIIRFPFEQMAGNFEGTTLVRFNRDYPQLTTPYVTRYIAFQEKLNKSLLQAIASMATMSVSA